MRDEFYEVIWMELTPTEDQDDEDGFLPTPEWDLDLKAGNKRFANALANNAEHEQSRRQKLSAARRRSHSAA
ncbi:MAG: hypothetical protein AB8B57_03050 [Congregibacter sp.]